MATLARLIQPTKALCHRPDKRSAIRQRTRGICRMATLTRLIRPTKALCHQAVPGNPNAMKAKTRRSGFLHEEVKLTDKAASFNHTSGIYSAGVVLCCTLYLSL